MKLYIFKTDIKSDTKIDLIKKLFNVSKTILDWHIDMEDRDNVLRIEATDGLQEQEVVTMVNNFGFFCEPLED